jgi:P-type Ca2+ transporter type 2C
MEDREGRSCKSCGTRNRWRKLIDITPAQSGLDAITASDHLVQYGPNRFDEEKSPSMWARFLHQFKDTMILILIVAAVLSGLMGELIDAIIILLIVVLNAVLGIVQEDKAEKALKALKAMSAPGAKVIRDGIEQLINADQVVPFDILVLEAGDVVAADVRLLKTSSLQIQESSLTGESVPVDKDANALVAENAALGDRRNMAYTSSMVTYGRGVGLVVATGMQTEVGKIAGLLSHAAQEPTPLQKKLDGLGKDLGTCCSCRRAHLVWSGHCVWARSSGDVSNSDILGGCGDSGKSTGRIDHRVGDGGSTHGETECHHS